MLRIGWLNLHRSGQGPQELEEYREVTGRTASYGMPEHARGRLAGDPVALARQVFDK
jgi:hypothetical protein